MFKKIIIAIAFLVLFLANQSFANELWVCLIDGSGSMGDDLLNKNLKKVELIMQSLPKGASFNIVAFGRSSSVDLLKVKMPDKAGPGNINLINTQKAAKAKLRENLSRLSTLDRSSTDVIGGLLKAERLFTENQAGNKRLYIMSDMLDTANLAMGFKSLSKKGCQARLLAQSAALPAPNLERTDIFIYAVFEPDHKYSAVEIESSIKESKSFWLEYFKGTGGNLIQYQTTY